MPHGIYDVGLNKGYLSLGKSRDTSEFLCDNVKYCWKNQISLDYPKAKEMLLLMDGGGSNSCRHYIVKEDLQNLANELKMTIRVAHYPPYCSKYNPIEHRFFPHLQRSWEGVLFTDYAHCQRASRANDDANRIKGSRVDKRKTVSQRKKI